jgi:hypothetical protein
MARLGVARHGEEQGAARRGAAWRGKARLGKEQGNQLNINQGGKQWNSIKSHLKGSHRY